MGKEFDILISSPIAGSPRWNEAAFWARMGENGELWCKLSAMFYHHLNILFTDLEHRCISDIFLAFCWLRWPVGSFQLQPVPQQLRPGCHHCRHLQLPHLRVRRTGCVRDSRKSGEGSGLQYRGHGGYKIFLQPNIWSTNQINDNKVTRIFVFQQSTGLAFIAIPEATLDMDIPQLWSFLFFFMMVNLALSSICRHEQIFWLRQELKESLSLFVQFKPV